jgi:hypothetical protein
VVKRKKPKEGFSREAFSLTRPLRDVCKESSYCELESS